MDSTQVGVFKKANQTGFTFLLQSTNSCTLEAQICFKVLSNFSHQFSNQKFSGLLVPSSRGHTFTSGFGNQLLPRCFNTDGFAGTLLCLSLDTFTFTLFLQLEQLKLEVVLALESKDAGKHCVLLYPLIYWWAFGLLPNLNYCKWDCNEHTGAFILSN